MGVAPAGPDTVLPLFLRVRRAVSALPERPLGREDDVTRQVTPRQPDHSVQYRLGLTIAFGVIDKISRTRLPQFLRLQKTLDLARGGLRRNETAVTAPLDRLQPR